MIRSITTNGTQVYYLSAGKTLPEFIKEGKGSASLKKDVDYKRRIELIQDLEFPISSGMIAQCLQAFLVAGKIRVSEDQQFLGAVGIYPPEVRIFDTNQLAMKFKRGFDCEVVDFRFLSPDYRKLVFLHSDRTIEFHAQGGRHHRLRIPHVGRALEYLKNTAELLVVGSMPEVYRLDLEAGTFATPIMAKSDQINCCATSPSLPIVCLGGSGGIVEVFDHRQWKSATTLRVVQDSDDLYNGNFVTALQFSPDGLLMCAGTSSGICRIFDIRSSQPLAERDHRNLSPIVDLQIVERRDLLDGSASEDRLTVVSADKKSVKIWALGNNNLRFDKSQGVQQTRMIASLEPELAKETPGVKVTKTPGAINNVAVFPKSGLIFVAQDNPRISLYFVPKLGLAPRWCSFLDSLTEELEESSEQTVYDDYQFITKIQLEEMGADHLIGTPLLRAYMHGYFMDARLYQKLKAVSQPFAIEDFRKQKVQEGIAKSRKMRIQIKRKLPTVNKEFASKLEDNASAINSKVALAAKSILTDERFSQLFTNPGFTIESVPVDDISATTKKKAQVEAILHGPVSGKRRRKV